MTATTERAETLFAAAQKTEQASAITPACSNPSQKAIKERSKSMILEIQHFGTPIYLEDGYTYTGRVMGIVLAQVWRAGLLEEFQESQRLATSEHKLVEWIQSWAARVGVALPERAAL